MSPDGKATILFDAPQAEVRTLLWGGDGALYAGTAAEAGGGSTSRGSLFLTQGATVPRFLDGAGTRSRRWRPSRRRPMTIGLLIRCGSRRAAAPRRRPAAPRPRAAARLRPGRSRRRQRRLSARRRRRAARGVEGQGAGPRAGLGRRSAFGRHRAGGPALRGARPRRGDGADRQAR